MATAQSAPAVTAGTFVYVTGGFTGSNATSATEFARVGAGGALLAIADTRSFAQRRGAVAAYVVNGEFYAMGGTSGTTPASAALDSSQLSTLTASGAPGNFSNASVSMVSPRQSFGLALASAYFFAVGGTSTGANALATVEQTIY